MTQEERMQELHDQMEMAKEEHDRGLVENYKYLMHLISLIMAAADLVTCK